MLSERISENFSRFLIEEAQVAGTCTTHGNEKYVYQNFYSENLKREDHTGDSAV
jgi:hypothetical protein